MATLATIALVTSAIAGVGSAVSSSRQGKKAASKTKRERGRQGQEREKLEAEQVEVEEKEKARLKRDDQRRAKLAKRGGAAGREGTLIPLSSPAVGGQSTATKEFIGV